MRSYLAAVMLCSVGALYAQSPEVQVNTSSGVYYPNEPSVCISKTKENTVVAGANTNSHYYSKDDGKTWENKTLESTFEIGRAASREKERSPARLGLCGT